jgi:aspartate/methionine/tyrosine aminotransferase
MQLKPFLLDQWLARYAERDVAFNLGGSTGPAWTIDEVLRLAGPDARSALLEAVIAYGPSTGRQPLREAIAEMLGASADEVIVVAGGSEALLHLFFHSAEPGANVVVPFPAFPPYHAIPESQGLAVRTYGLRPEDAYRVDPDEVARLIDRRTKLLLVNSPHNPTGATIADEEMRALHDLAVERNVQFASDEVFHPIYHGVARTSTARLPRATVIGDCSKAFALPGLRVGWILERDRRRREAYVNAREYFSISNTVAGEHLATIAVRHRAEVLGRTREVAASNLQRLGRVVADHADRLEWVPPAGGMTAFIRLAGTADARPFCEAAVERGLLLTPGDCFGIPGYIRVGFGVGPGWYGQAMERLSGILRDSTAAPGRTATAGVRS